MGRQYGLGRKIYGAQTYVAGGPLYIFDLDGTIADISHRLHYITGDKKDWDAFNAACVDDKPISQIVSLVHIIQYSGYHVGIWTGRSISTRRHTMRWLEEYRILPIELQMRPCGDYRPDVELKGEWLDAAIEQCNPPTVIFEDRTKMVEYYRSRNFTCVQVAESTY